MEATWNFKERRAEYKGLIADRIWQDTPSKGDLSPVMASFGQEQARVASIWWGITTPRMPNKDKPMFRKLVF